MDLTNNLLFVSLIMAAISANGWLIVFVAKTLMQLRKDVDYILARLERREGDRLGSHYRAIDN